MSPEQYARYVEAQLRKSPSRDTVWEFNAQCPDDDRDQIRFFATFNYPKLVKWSWVDVHVRYPMMRLKAWLMNPTRKPKRLILRGLDGAVLTPEQAEKARREVDEDCGP